MKQMIIQHKVGEMTFYRLDDTWSTDMNKATIYIDTLPQLGPDAEPWDFVVVDES